MYILGFGKAFPTHPLGGERFTSLPLPYIKETKNIPIKNALMHAVNSPSEIGESALRAAIEKAKLSVEDITYAIGDTSTPWETCPSEGQRVAGRLGLKVPAYDVTGIGCALSATLFALTKWRDVPSLIAWVSSNLITQVVDFSEGTEKDVFGDGAGACVLSADRKQGFKVEKVEYTLNHSSKFVIEQDLFGAIKIKGLPTSEDLKKEFEPFLPSNFNGIIVAPPIIKSQISSWGEVVSHNHGELLGSNTAVTLSEIDVPVDSQVLVLEKSGGGGTGMILLRRVS